jgi:hypothetical protein
MEEPLMALSKKRNQKKFLRRTAVLEVHPNFPKEIEIEPIIQKYGGQIDQHGFWTGGDPDFQSSRGKDKIPWQEAIGRLTQRALKNRIAQVSKTVRHQGKLGF